VLTFHEGWIFGLGALLAGPLSGRTDPRLPLIGGLVGFAIVYFWLGGISAVATSTLIVGLLCLRSFSYAWVNVPNMLMTPRTLPEDQVGMATGLFSVARSISGTLGVALSATLWEHQRATHAIELAQQQGSLELPSQWTMTSLQQTFASLGEGTSVAQMQATAYFHDLMVSEATITAYQDIFLLSGYIGSLIFSQACCARIGSSNGIFAPPTLVARLRQRPPLTGGDSYGYDFSAPRQPTVRRSAA
jgi:DHA2 family multidrug resistance protein